jgi:hypothetical protein
LELKFLLNVIQPEKAYQEFRKFSGGSKNEALQSFNLKPPVFILTKSQNFSTNYFCQRLKVERLSPNPKKIGLKDN